MILSTVLKYMSTKTLERMSSINSQMQSEYKKRINSTVYSSKLIDKAQPILPISSLFKQNKQMIKAYTVFNSICGESILILFDEDNKLLLYDLKFNQFQLELKNLFDNKEEYVASVQHYYNANMKIDYVALCSSRKGIVILKYCEGFELEETNRIVSFINTDKQCFNGSIYPFQIITSDYFAMINRKLEVTSFEGKFLVSTSKIHSESAYVNGFVSRKDKQTYLYTYFCQGISSFKLIHEKRIKIESYRTYASWNKKTGLVQYFYSEEANKEFLIESNSGNLIFWDFRTGESTMKLAISLVDGIFSMTKWNGDILYLTTYSGKLYQASFSNKKVAQSPIVFEDISFISAIKIHQPSLICLFSDGSVHVLTYDREASA